MNDRQERTFNRLEVEEIARRASDESIQATFKLFGVDIKNQDSINQLRSDLIWSRRQRKLSEMIGGKVVMSIVTIVVGAVMIALWEYVRLVLGRP